MTNGLKLSRYWKKNPILTLKLGGPKHQTRVYPRLTLLTADVVNHKTSLNRVVFEIDIPSSRLFEVMAPNFFLCQTCDEAKP